MFEERLKKFRESKGCKKYEFAKLLGVSESYYNMIENRKKNPSKNFIIKLVKLSNKPEVYWFYGIDDTENKSKRESENNYLKNTRNIVNQLNELGMLNNIDNLFLNCCDEGTIGEFLLVALKKDISSILNNQKRIDTR